MHQPTASRLLKSDTWHSLSSSMTIYGIC